MNEPEEQLAVFGLYDALRNANYFSLLAERDRRIKLGFYISTTLGALVAAAFAGISIFARELTPLSEQWATARPGGCSLGEVGLIWADDTQQGGSEVAGDLVGQNPLSMCGFGLTKAKFWRDRRTLKTYSDCAVSHPFDRRRDMELGHRYVRHRFKRIRHVDSIGVDRQSLEQWAT